MLFASPVGVEVDAVEEHADKSKAAQKEAKIGWAKYLMTKRDMDEFKKS